MKATLEFNMEEEQDVVHFKASLKGPQLTSVLYSFMEQVLRKDRKYSEDETRSRIAQEYTEALCDLLDTYNITLDELY